MVNHKTTQRYACAPKETHADPAAIHKEGMQQLHGRMLSAPACAHASCACYAYP